MRLRICLFDKILEEHVPDSLLRALSARGHTAWSTGWVWKGWKFPTSGPDRERLALVVDQVIAARPDVVVVMRPAALRREQLDRLKKSGITMVAWYSDDPVFFNVQGRRTAALYDITLHTATAPVLEHYESELGVRGLAFPYWTDAQAFPRRYDPARCDVDVVFIGNTHSKTKTFSSVKAWRYDWIAGLPLSRAIYGHVADDYANIHAGEAKGDAQLGEACARGRFGLNISQRFSDYADSEMDYPELAGFGEFSLPSRIVQLGAVGTPVISLVHGEQAEQDLATLFPSVITARGRQQVVEAVLALRDDPAQLAVLSDRVHRDYSTQHTALARARFLEVLVAEPDRWKVLPADERATAFRSVAAEEAPAAAPTFRPLSTPAP